MEESYARQTGNQLNINPSGSPKASYSAIPIPPPSLPSPNRRHFKPNRYWFNNYENISSCLNISTGVYTGPLYDMWKPPNLKAEGRQATTGLNIVWLIYPPTDVQRWAVYSATVDAPTEGTNHNRKIPLPTRDERSQLTSRTGRTTQELSRDFLADPRRF